MELKRRELLAGVGSVGAGLILWSCGSANKTGESQSPSSPHKDEDEKGGEVTATEDLMREHGVLRRALFVYTAAAERLRRDPSSVPPDALQKTAKLFRDFGEDYHEKKLEEAYIFPAVKQAGGDAAAYADVLVVQHNRGREITEYVLTVTRGAKLGAANAAA